MLLILASLALSLLVGCGRVPEAVAPLPDLLESSGVDPIRPTPVALRKSPGTQEAPADRAESSPAPAAEELTFADLYFDLPWLEPQSPGGFKKQEPFTRDLVPAAAMERDGNRVVITGYISPHYVFKGRGIDSFVLAADITENLISPPLLSEAVVVRMLPGTSTDFTTWPIEVEGIFSIEELRDGDGDVICIYHLRDAVVRRPRSRSASLR